MKIYDYNQEFGGNYYQPMLQYINKKDIMGPFNKKQIIDLPRSAEVTSDKYTNMRHYDKNLSTLELEAFLIKAYAKQIKELNSSTAMAHNVNTPYNSMKLLKGTSSLSSERVSHYASELHISKDNRLRSAAIEKKHCLDIEAFGDFEYHHKLFDGPIDRNQQFWRPEKLSGLAQEDLETPLAAGMHKKVSSSLGFSKKITSGRFQESIALLRVTSFIF
ncbi:unnamed protein product [Lepeophtheirus salmonis]|uniref:(salmon louse) hypothetical protein n=1 Tax=Lepeophtheirus salmonis TaxID=72036 RepID=A0A7R8H239_LEPSM|nr:unnamed protein product [Lepeophtheirus salmonis]CAF2820599.1 unnamed protein product [Lepeophtheirus salmonis]